MKQPLITTLLFIQCLFIYTLSLGQDIKVVGTFGSYVPRVQITFNPDSTFNYVTNELHPTFYRWENFSEKGKYTLSGDTIILNPTLPKKPYIETEFIQKEQPANPNLLLTFNHIKRYYDLKGNMINSDTFRIERVDYSFNKLKKKNLRRITAFPTIRCAFASYIPKETIVSNHTIEIPRPQHDLKSIFIGCYELHGTKEFIINNPGANHFTLNVYSNYYEDGQIRQTKFLVKGKNVNNTRQKENGQFYKNDFSAGTGNTFKRLKSGS
jgi:hypothetical protein